MNSYPAIIRQSFNMPSLLSSLAGVFAKETTKSATLCKEDVESLPLKSILSDVPEEIIRMILTFLSQSALYQVTLVNRKFNRLSVRLLYETFDQHGPDSRSLCQFLEVTKKIKPLAKTTRVINIYGSPRISSLQAHHSFSKSRRAKWARELYANHQEYGYRNLEHGPDMAVLLLLSSLPDVRSIRVLHVSNSMGRESDPLLPIYLAPLRNALGAKYRYPSCFSKLSKLEFGLFEFSWPVIAPLFCLPSLKSLTIMGATEKDGHTPAKETIVPPRSSTIEVLRFTACNMSCQTTAVAVSACNTLKSLVHCYNDDDNFDTYRNLYTHLCEHRATLHTLVCVGRNELDLEPPTDVSFAEFPALRILALDYSIVPVTTLPPNLEWLILDAGGKDDIRLFHVLSQLGQRLQDVKYGANIQIGLRYMYKKRSGRYIDFRKICKIFKAHGFELSLRVSAEGAMICQLNVSFFPLIVANVDPRGIRCYSERNGSNYAFVESSCSYQ